MQDPKKIRNIAIIAHIDHGKTTLLDALLKQANIFQPHELVPERIMDMNDQEKERGITIFAKHTAITYHDFKINIIDTPGHSDFSGEVERILGMVQGVLLLVDAQEGPMPQTRFVLSKSLAYGLKPIVVLNKIDRPHADPDRVLNETFDLFAELGASDEQLDFAYCYASGLSGFAMRNLHDAKKDLDPLFSLIIESVPPPPGNIKEPFLMQVATLNYNTYVGRQACGRILQGTIQKNAPIILVDREGREMPFNISKIEGYLGLEKIEMDEASTGDIVNLSGIPSVMIGDTICSPVKVIQLPPIPLEEPTLSIDVMVNTSPLVGREGTHVTMNKLKERLEQEKRANVSLKIEFPSHDRITVSGRGELHLSVLIETLRREGLELSISKPRVIFKTIDGVLQEPLERAHIEVPQEYSGATIEEISRRKGELQALTTTEYGIAKMQFIVPTRGLMGFRSRFLTMTRGLGILSTLFEGYAPHRGTIPGRIKGVLIANGSGKVNAYSCFHLQDRGTLFVSHGEDVYEGMIIGEHSRENDLVVNITRAKQLTNVRASGSDENLILEPPRRFTLEQAIDFIEEDELIEVTPRSVRLRKKELKEMDRKRTCRQST